MKCLEESPYKLACMEVWGGNRSKAQSVDLPGLFGWVYSYPLGPSRGGGDVHYLSVCNKGLLSRVAVADVSGHGQAANLVAERLRVLIHKHINTWDQSALMREINEAFHKDRTGIEYATAIVLGFHLPSCLLFSNAGHLPPLWYHAAEGKWDFLEDNTPRAMRVEGLPLGIIPMTEYRQTGVQVGLKDLLVIYTDGITEVVDEAGDELGKERLLELVNVCPVESPLTTGKALLTAVQAFQGSALTCDDQTLVVLQRTET
jgi:phosphoserine phosphatase RsbU/P